MDRVTCINTATPNPYLLTAIRIDTHETKTFRFGLSVDSHFRPASWRVHATIDGKCVKRPSTSSS